MTRRWWWGLLLLLLLAALFALFAVVGPSPRWSQEVDRHQVILGAMLPVCAVLIAVMGIFNPFDRHLWSLATGTMIMGTIALLQSHWLAVPGMGPECTEVVRDLLLFWVGPLFFHYIAFSALREHVPPPVRTAAAWAFCYPVAMTAAFVPLGAAWIDWADNRINDFFLLLLAALAIAFAIRDALRGDRNAQILSAAILVFVGLGIAEIAIAQLGVDGPRYLHFLGLLALVLGLILVMARRLEGLHREATDANRRLRELNRGLEDRVDERTAALAEREREQRELLHVLCHDLANPVGAASGAAEMIDQDPERWKELGPPLRNAVDNAANMIRLVQRLRRLEQRPPSLEPVRLQPCVRSAIEIVAGKAADKDIEFAADVPPDLRVLADRTALIASVLANLLTNAIKFSPRGSAVRVEASDRGESLCVRVIDRGVGIPEDRRHHLFDLDRVGSTLGTEGEEGNGFGLPMVAKFMALFGGTVEAESAPGEGTTMVLSFPRSS